VSIPSAEATNYFNLGVLYGKLSENKKMTAAFRKALERDPNLFEAKFALANHYKKSVSHWHFPMLNDKYRNELSLAALQARVSPGSVVLDLGTGPGLLAMMAAKYVYACKLVPELA